VTSEIVETAKHEVMREKPLKFLRAIELERMTEGECVQVLHVGPYSTEPASIAKMEKLLGEKGTWYRTAFITRSTFLPLEKFSPSE
jgi:hypothetical protein